MKTPAVQQFRTWLHRRRTGAAVKTVRREPGVGARFDDLARSAGSNVSRRGALKITALGLAGLTLYRLGWPNAWAAGNCLCNGIVYDSDSGCCTAHGVVQKNPIANLADCPNKVKNATHVCSPNGCGGEGGYQPPQGFFKANFMPACNTHDCCYDTCNGDKAACDNAFLAALQASCQAAYPGTGVLDGIKRSSCLSAASTYYDFVHAFGQKYFDQAQRQACDCCGQQNCATCAGGVCGALPACAGGGDCVCFTTPQGDGACIHGDTPCAGAQVCASNSDCPPGYGCAATNCCGGSALCGPLCSDVTSAGAALVSPFGRPTPGAAGPRGPTLGGK